MRGGKVKKKRIQTRKKMSISCLDSAGDAGLPSREGGTSKIRPKVQQPRPSFSLRFAYILGAPSPRRSTTRPPSADPRHKQLRKRGITLSLLLCRLMQTKWMKYTHVDPTSPGSMLNTKKKTHRDTPCVFFTYIFCFLTLHSQCLSSRRRPCARPLGCCTAASRPRPP